MDQKQSKKKILFVITKGTWGGAQKYVFDIATAFKDSADVVVAYGTPGELSTQLTEHGIRAIRIDSLERDVNPLLDISSFFALVKIFNKEKPDVVHLNSSKIGGLGALAGRILGIKKIIFTAHGWVFNENRNTLSKSIVWFLSWLTVLFSTTVIVLGEHEKQQTLAMPFVGPKKVALIHLGVRDINFLSQIEAREILREILHVPEHFFLNKKIIGTISELTPNKGLNFALNAISPTSDFMFIIIGAGELDASLRALIRERGIGEKVFLTGFIENAEKLLKAFDIFLLSSVKEGLPYVLLQAGIAELPVITTSVGNIPELISNTHTGILISPRSSKAIESAITNVITHPTEAILYGKNLKQVVCKNFSLQVMIDVLTTLYTS